MCFCTKVLLDTGYQQSQHCHIFQHFCFHTHIITGTKDHKYSIGASEPNNIKRKQTLTILRCDKYKLYLPQVHWGSNQTLIWSQLTLLWVVSVWHDDAYLIYH